jgi:hypothetical protein
MKNGDIELHIEELILHGPAIGDPGRIKAAVEAELARLFTERGAPFAAQDREVPHIDAGRFETAPGSAPEAIGGQVALAVYGGLK